MPRGRRQDQWSAPAGRYRAHPPNVTFWSRPMIGWSPWSPRLFSNVTRPSGASFRAGTSVFTVGGEAAETATVGQRIHALGTPAAVCRHREARRWLRWVVSARRAGKAIEALGWRRSVGRICGGRIQRTLMPVGPRRPVEALFFIESSCLPGMGERARSKAGQESICFPTRDSAAWPWGYAWGDFRSPPRR